jgi:hypothetical protein
MGVGYAAQGQEQREDGRIVTGPNDDNTDTFAREV